jgi:glycogen(starch) synthase
VAQDVAVHVLTRGREHDLPEEVRAGVRVHRMPEPAMPRDLDEFVTWVEGMNEHMLAAGRVLTERYDFDVIHGHDWLSRPAAAGLARAARRPYLTTVHATEYGRHQGWVDKHPQSYIHGVERWMVRRAEGVVVCSHYMQGHVADVFGIDEAKIEVIPNGIDPLDLAPVDDLAACGARFADPAEKLVLLIGRLVYEKGFQIALDALPRVIARLDGVRFLVAGSGTHEPSSRRRRGAWASSATAASWAGSATTCCARCTGSPTCAWCRRSTSPSAWWRWRRWPAAARASSPTPAACARSCPTRTSACASARATRARWRR